ENLLQNQLFERGHSLYYDPRILVWHHAHADRVRQNWFLRRYYWEGRSQAIFDRIVGSPSWRGRVRATSKALWHGCRESSSLLLQMKVDDDVSFLTKCGLYKQAGYLHGLLLQPPVRTARRVLGRRLRGDRG